jgi:hypothetical protein
MQRLKKMKLAIKDRLVALMRPAPGPKMA